MVMDGELLQGRDKRNEDVVHSRTQRPRAAGDILHENQLSNLDLSNTNTPPSDLNLVPAPEYRKLSRGISRATDNEGLVWALRSGTAMPAEPAALSSDHIFLLPDITAYPESFRIFLERDLLETAALVSLESTGRLNWWCGGIVSSAPRLLPLATSGDGNCLPHAASLAAWGFHDRLLALRSRVCALLAGDGGLGLADALQRRWRWAESAQLARAGLRPSTEEWRAEWRAAVAAASPEPRAAGATAPAYHGLDELHVLALAHVMRRPIIVFADLVLRDLKGDAIAPILFGGIYLPLELDPRACSRAPLLLAYDAGHFSALVPCEPLPVGGCRVPLEDSNGTPLPIRFNVDPGEDFDWDETLEPGKLNRLLPDQTQRASMLAAYLDIEYVPSHGSNQTPMELRRSLDALDPSCGSKQLNSVVKQFGSIGRSMSHKIKKNFGSMAKLSSKSSNSSSTADMAYESFSRSNKGVLCCRVLAARAPVQEEMVRNYIEEAWARHTATQTTPTVPRYGTGRSQFYTEASSASHELMRKLPPATPKQNQDRTLYLSRSTFYDDRPPEPLLPSDSPKPCRAPLCLFYGSAANNDYCSRCARLQE